MDRVFPNQRLLRILPIIIPRLEGKEGLLDLLLPVAKEEVEIISTTSSVPIALKSQVSVWWRD